MNLKKLLAMPWAMPVLAAAATASLVISSWVFAEMVMPTAIQIGQMMVNEEKTFAIARINETITDSLNFTVNCLGKDSVNMRVIKPVGSDNPASVQLELNGTTVINEPGRKLETGNLTIVVRGVKQGLFNCTLVPVNSSATVITWVSSL